MIQRWTGTVVEFDGKTVCARLRDETDPSRPEEFAEILLEKMYGYQRRIRRYVRPGARFIWTIRVKRAGRHKEKAASEFYFPYVGKWTRRDLKKIRRFEREFEQIFGKMPREGKFNMWFPERLPGGWGQEPKRAARAP